MKTATRKKSKLDSFRDWLEEKHSIGGYAAGLARDYTRAGLSRKNFPLAFEASLITAREHPLTLRGLFYRVVSAGLLPNTNKEHYVRLGRVMNALREDGIIPFSHLVDNLRSTVKPSSWAGLAFEIRDDSILWHADQVSISADEALRRASGPTSNGDRGKKGEAARALLRSLDLRNFSKPQAEIRQLAEDQGISYDTLHRAFKDMGGVAERGGFGGAVRWRIPESQPDLSAFDEWNQGAATV